MARDSHRVLRTSHTSILLLLLIASGNVIGDVGVMASFDLGSGIPSSSRNLLSSPWTSSAPDRVCWPSYDGTCRAGDFALLAADAPAPTSLGGRLLLKTLAQGYQCWEHQTIDECQDDKDNRCTWLTDNSVCNTNSTAQLLTVREALLCPDSLSEQLFRCSIKLKEQECSSMSGCSWSDAAGSCIPATVAVMAAEELERLLPSVSKLDASVWGCCEGHRILKAMLTCSSAQSLTQCSSPFCRWDFGGASCSLSQQGLLEKVLAREEGDLVAFIKQSDSVCSGNPGNLGACASDAVFNIDADKVARYAAWVPTVEERGSCGQDLINGTHFTPEAAVKDQDGPLASKNETTVAFSVDAQNTNQTAVASIGKKMVAVNGITVMIAAWIALLISMLTWS